MTADIQHVGLTGTRFGRVSARPEPESSVEIASASEVAEPAGMPRGEQPQPERVEPEQSQPEQSQPEQTGSGPGAPDQADAGQPRAGQAEAAPAETEQTESLQTESAEPAPADSAQVQPAQVQPAQVQPAQVQPAQVQPAQVQPAQVQPAQTETEQVQPELAEPAQTEPAQTETEQAESEQVETGRGQRGRARPRGARFLRVSRGRGIQAQHEAQHEAQRQAEPKQPETSAVPSQREPHKAPVPPLPHPQRPIPPLPHPQAPPAPRPPQPQRAPVPPQRGPLGDQTLDRAPLGEPPLGWAPFRASPLDTSPAGTYPEPLIDHGDSPRDPSVPHGLGLGLDHPGEDEIDYDAISAPTVRVRPYIHTGGRTRITAPLPIESMVCTRPGVSALRLNGAHRWVAELCSVPQSVAEVSAHLGVPLAVARVVVDDLLEQRMVTVQRGIENRTPDRSLMERVLAGLRRL